MSLLPRKGLLAIAAVIDVALNGCERPVSARKLAARHNLPPRHLEPVLQALVHEGIFNGIRGPRGVSSSAATSLRRARATCAMTSCAIRMPRVMTNGASPWFTSSTWISPR